MSDALPAIVMTVAERDRSGRYDAHVEGRHLLTSATPFFDGARALVAQGYDPQRRLVMRRAGRDQDDVAAPLGVAAGLRVAEGDWQPPKLRSYRPWKGQETGHASPPVSPPGRPPKRTSELTATTTPPNSTLHVEGPNPQAWRAMFHMAALCERDRHARVRVHRKP